MEFDVIERMNEIAEEIGGIEKLRMQLKNTGHSDWKNIEFYPVIAWFPQYMDTPDVVGIAIRDGFSFRLLYGCMKTPYDKVNEWYEYVSLHDHYHSITEALLDHHKALIATEVDFSDAREMEWKIIIQEVIDGLRPTKFNINDDDFLHRDELISEVEFNLTDVNHDPFKSFFDTLRKLSIVPIDTFLINSSNPIASETYTDVEISDDEDYNTEFKNEWC